MSDNGNTRGKDGEDAAKAITEMIRSFNSLPDPKDFAPSISRFMSDMSPQLRLAGDVATRWTQYVTEMNRKTIKALAGMNSQRMLSGFLATLAPLVSVMEEVREVEQSDFPFKWAHSLPLPIFRRLFYTWRKGGEEAAYRLLTVELVDDETLEYLIGECSKCQTVACHTEAVAEALWAHRQGKYFLSVPVLIAQTEGVLRRTALAMGAIETMKGPSGGRYYRIKTVLEKMESEIVGTVGGSGGSEDDSGNSQISAPIFGPFIAFLSDHYFSDYRNPIMHGNDAEYGSVELSAECVLALNEALRLAADVERYMRRVKEPN